MLRPRAQGVRAGDASRSRSCTSTPGTTSPRCSSTATAGSSELGLQLVVASVQDAIDRGLVREEPERLAQPDPDAGPARRRRAQRVRRAVRRRPSRRGEGPGQGARLLVPRRVRPVGPEEPATRALEPLQRPRAPPGEHIRVFPLSNWTELDIWHVHRARRRSRSPSIYFAHEREVFERDGMLYAVNEFIAAAGPARRRTPQTVRYRTVGDANLHRRPWSPTPTRSSRSSTRSRPSGSPSAARPAATTRSARPPWKIARRRATSDGRRAPPLRHRGLGRRRQEHADRAAAVRLQVDLRGPARGGRARRAATAATTTPTSRCSPTACAPSASRASRSTWPTATSRRRGASSSSPTPRATSSTPATWSPVPRRPTSR